MKTQSKSSAREFCILSLEDMDLLRWVVWRDQKGHLGVHFPGSVKPRNLSNVIAERMGLEIPDGYIVDHINRIPLDNRRDNLRVVTQAQNLANNGKLGVYQIKKTKKWTAIVTRNYKKIHLGTFKTKEKALEARKVFLDKEGLVQ